MPQFQRTQNKHKLYIFNKIKENLFPSHLNNIS